MRKNNLKMYVIGNKKHQLTDTEHFFKLSLYGFIYLFFFSGFSVVISILSNHSVTDPVASIFSPGFRRER